MKGDIVEHKWKGYYFLVPNDKGTRIDWEKTKANITEWLKKRSSSPSAAAMEAIEIEGRLRRMVKRHGSHNITQAVIRFHMTAIKLFLEKADLGLFEEEDTIKLVQEHLITIEQQNDLEFLELTIGDILNGRIFSEAAELRINEMYREWNAKLGRVFFIYY